MRALVCQIMCSAFLVLWHFLQPGRGEKMSRKSLFSGILLIGQEGSLITAGLVKSEHLKILVVLVANWLDLSFIKLNVKC